METYEEVIAILDRMPRKELRKVYNYLSQMKLWRDGEKRDTPGEDYREYVKVMNDIIGVDVRGKGRSRDLVWGRYVIMHKMAMDGCPVTHIGKLFGVTHCTVIYARDTVDKMLLSPRMFPYEMTVYHEFYKRLNDN